MFAPERKRPLPRIRSRIALVTSREAAALQDMLKVLRRFPWLKLVADARARAGRRCRASASRRRSIALGCRSDGVGGIDVILLGRGGGSLEDLWAFNEEVVARAIAGCSIPVVTGIGHEVDTSIADLVADYHAHTPTEAAQVVTQNWRTVHDELDAAALRLRAKLARWCRMPGSG